MPDDEHQRMVSEIIYGEIKRNRPADMERFGEITDHMRSLGCERLILGCTELSLIKRDNRLWDYYTVSLECLALETIKACGKRTILPSDN